MKFCILAAGIGTRNTHVKGLHKALLPIENKPVISHIIDKIDETIKIVVALGHKAEQVSSYLIDVYGKDRFEFVYVDNYDKKDSGPGYSLLCCKQHLQCPFIFTSVDTLIDEHIDCKIKNNWIGASNIELQYSEKYCLIEGCKTLNKIYYGHGTQAFVGMAGIYDYSDFWKSLENKKIIKGEYQVVHGFKNIKTVNIKKLKWYDTGNDENYANVKNKFNNDIVACKNDEVVFIDKNRVVKYFNSREKLDYRVNRFSFLSGVTPDIKKINDNMYSYEYIDGKMLSENYDERIMESFFNFCEKELFIRENPTDSFYKDCKKMYEEKTKERIKKYIGSDLDNIKYVNGVKVEPISVLISKIDWSSIYNEAICSKFHGDLQPENIIYGNNHKFYLIDWREKFGDSLNVGDMYYDLSKLYHALLINGRCILNNMYDVQMTNDFSFFKMYPKNNLIFLHDMLKKFCNRKNYNWKNVVLIGILHYINICSLYEQFHNGKYEKFLFLYGKYMLTKFFEGDL